MATYARLAYQPKSPEPNQIPIPRFRYNVNPNEEQIKKFWLDEYAQTIIFCPHSLILHNCWQAEHFIELAQLIKQSFPYIQMLCIGDNKGYNTSLKIVASLTNILNLCGKIDMQQTLTLLARSSVVISNYSELMHLSTALRCKVIALYRSINIQHFPLSKKLIPIMRNLNYESQDEEIPSPIEVFNLTRKVLKNRIHLRANIK